MKKNTTIIAAILFCTGIAKSQVVSLFAGSQYVGDGAYSGAISAINKFTDSFSVPGGIAPDTSGRFYITEQHNVMIISGSSSIVLGGNTGNPAVPGGSGYSNSSGTQSLFANPAGCEVNRKTNRVVLCDLDNNLIRAQNGPYTPGQATLWTTLAGVQSFLGGYKDGSTSAAEFNGPQDVAVSSDGSSVYVADGYNHCIRKIKSGQVTTIAGLGETSGDATGSGSVARFYVPTGLFLADDNTLYVADRNNGKIKKINLSTNTVTTVVSNLNAPTDMVVVGGVIYIADSYCIRSWDGTTLKDYAGKTNSSGYTNGSGTAARFRNISTIAYDDKTKSIYVTDWGNNVFRQVTVIQPPVADFIADNVSPTVGKVVTLINKSQYHKTVSWTVSPANYTLQNGSTLSDSLVYLSFTQTGSYTVELTATNPAGSDKKTKNAYINVSLIGSNKPSPDFYADKTVAAVGETVSFIDQTGDNPQSFSWTFTPATVTYQNSTTSTSRFPKVSFNAAGKYTVQLTATNNNGSNSKTRTDYINVTSAGTTTPVTGELLFFPNPAASELHVLGDVNEITLSGINGQVIILPVKNGSVDISRLSDGIYAASAVDMHGKSFRGRFVKVSN